MAHCGRIGFDQKFDQVQMYNSFIMVILGYVLGDLTAGFPSDELLFNVQWVKLLPVLKEL